MIDVPVMRLELQGMKLSMLTALQGRWSDMEHALNVGIDQAMTELPILIASRMKSAAIDAVDNAVREAVEEYFTSGEGAEKIHAYIAGKFKP